MPGEKCIVPTCPNSAGGGDGMWLQAIPDVRSCSEGKDSDINLQKAGFICMPCWKTINGIGDRHSWLHKSCTGFKKC